MIVDDTNTSIFKQPSHQGMLSLYGCYPFGALDRRLVVQLHLTHTFIEKKSDLPLYLYGQDSI